MGGKIFNVCMSSHPHRLKSGRNTMETSETPAWVYDALLIKINNNRPHRMHKHLKKDYGSREPYLENKSIKNRLKSSQPHIFIHLFPIMQLLKMRPMSSINNKNLDIKNEDVAKLGNINIHVYYGRVFNICI